MLIKVKCSHCNEDIELEIAAPKKRKKVAISEDVRKMRSENMKKNRKNRTKE